MKAWQQETAGPCDYKLAEGVAIPKAEPGKIVVRNITAGSNPIDFKACGPPYSTGKAFPAVFGVDGAGIVHEVAGDEAQNFGLKVGDKVFYLASSAYAEYTQVAAATAFKIPAEWNFTEAGTAGCVLITALVALFDKLNITKDDVVLINGASGGVGCIAVQIAKLAGVKKVIGICSERNFDFVKSLGADAVVDYTKGPESLAAQVKAETFGLGADKVFDCVCTDLPGLFPLTKFGGQLATILPSALDAGAAYAAFGANLGIHYVLILSYAAVPWTVAKLRALVDKALKEMIIPGKLKVPISHKFSFATGVMDAQVEIMKGRTAGKNVIIFDESAL